MSREIFIGGTDYSRQSLHDMIKDIKGWDKNINFTQDFFQQNIKILNKSGYWDTNVPYDFKILISRTTEIFATSTKELSEILNELGEEVRKDHVNRLW